MLLLYVGLRRTDNGVLITKYQKVEEISLLQELKS